MLWSTARYHLGLTSEEFFALTPRQFDSLMKRKEEQDQRAEMLMGISTAVGANHSFNTPKKAYVPEDFMPSKWKPAKPQEFDPLRFAEEMKAMVRCLPAGSVIFKQPGEE